MIEFFALLLAYVSAANGQLIEVRVTEGLTFTQCSTRATEKLEEHRNDAKGLRVYSACVPMPSPRYKGGL